jgi:N-methylhydantoinase A
VLWRASDKLPIERLDQEFSALARKAEKDFHSEGWKGAIRCQRSVDVRYRGQGYELNVPYTRGVMDDFRREHQRRYGYSYAGRELELVTLRLHAVIKSPQASLVKASVGKVLPPTSAKTATARSRARPERAPVLFGGKNVLAAIYARDQLRAGKKYFGPAVITEYSATTAVPPGMRFSVDQVRNLMIEIR